MGGWGQFLGTRVLGKFLSKRPGLGLRDSHGYGNPIMVNTRISSGLKDADTRAVKCLLSQFVKSLPMARHYRAASRGRQVLPPALQIAANSDLTRERKNAPRSVHARSVKCDIQGVPVGCTQSPFSPQFVPFGTTRWTLRLLTCKVHSGKGLSGRKGCVLVGCVDIRGHLRHLGAPVPN